VFQYGVYRDVGIVDAAGNVAPRLPQIDRCGIVYVRFPRYDYSSKCIGRCLRSLLIFLLEAADLGLIPGFIIADYRCLYCDQG